MKWLNKIKVIYLILPMFIFLMTPVGCDVAYKYDIESGIDDLVADSSNVTVKTDEGIDVSMYESARIFPGLVDTATEARINATITLDLTKQYVDGRTLGIMRAPRPIYSTGLYAGAGELVTIMVEGDLMGLSVIIGSHLDDLTAINPYLRLPVVTTSKALFPGKNTLRNPLGGMIWIEKSGLLTGAANFSLRIEGVYKSPDFIAGETNATDWVRLLRQTTIPWLELRGKHVAFSVQKDRILDLIEENASFAGQLEATLNTWDDALVEYYYNFFGLTVGNSDHRRRAPDFPERVVNDVQLLENLYIRNATYGILTLNTSHILNELTDFRTLKSGNSIGLFLALNNNYTFITPRNNPWGGSEMSGVLPVIPLYRIAEKGFRENNLPIGDIFTSSGESVENHFVEALSYADADSVKWFTSQIYNAVPRSIYALLSVVQLANYKNGNWAFPAELNRAAKLSETVVDNTSSNYFFRTLCDFYREDFTPFFDQWGMTLSDDGREYASQYPLMNKAIWRYNPLSSNPFENVSDYSNPKFPYRQNRKNWEVYSMDSTSFTVNSDTYSSVENMIDGNKSTRWSSIRTENQQPPLPYYVFVDRKEQSFFNGIYLSFGTGYWTTKVILEVLKNSVDNDTEVDYDNRDIEWETLMTIEGDDLSFMQNGRFFELPSPVNVRYLRLKFPEENTSYQEEYLTRKRIQEVAEFGTFYYKQ